MFKYDIIASSASCIALTLIALLVLSDKRAQTHPNKMIAYVCLCDAYSFSQYVIRYIVCGYGYSSTLNYLYAITVQYPWVYLTCKTQGSNYEKCWNGAQHTLETYQQFDTSAQQRLAGWYFISITISYVSLLLNSAIILELRLVIEDPFKPSEKRIAKYVAISVFLAVLFSYVGLKLTINKNKYLAQWNLRMYQTISLCNCIFACYRMIWISIRLKKPGVSGAIRREFRGRYIEYMCIYTIFSWPLCYITKPSYRYVATLNAFIGGTSFVSNDMYGYMIVLLSGVILASSRLRDRLTVQILKNLGLWITCRLPDKKKVDEAMKAANLNTFLTTSLNTEVVVTILKGITILAAASSDSVDNMKESDMLKIKQSANIQIEQIKILNPKYWEIGVQS